MTGDAFIIHSERDGLHIIQIRPSLRGDEKVAAWIRSVVTTCPLPFV